MRLVGQENAGIGENHGQGGAQFMGGVGHKLALPVPGLLHRAQGDGGQQQTDEKKAAKPAQANQQGDAYQTQQGLPLIDRINKGNVRPVRPDLAQIPQVQRREGALVGLKSQHLCHGVR
ncbi:hypothetical protein SDC9_103787 [bioreactor metagenome]|uniref:Uncharacterized protein n=1 Tax=bioreactor metagenome TaxID=1076179 RepID=A0A645AV06_9ZZZZ